MARHLDKQQLERFSSTRTRNEESSKNKGNSKVKFKRDDDSKVEKDNSEKVRWRQNK
jgi:hypothetical protein